MMRKRIGVFMGEVAAEYQQRVLQSIFEKAQKLNYDVFVFCNFGSYGDNVLYAEGEKGMIYLPEISALDGIIVGEDILDIEGMADELGEYLKENAGCPVVYLRTEKENFYSVRIDDLKTMEDMTRHFVVDHGFRDICFMIGKKGYADARNRYQGFLNVMKEAGIPVTEHMVFEGDYWREKGKEAVDWFMEGRSTYPQAIICSNDYMALSVCDELLKRGVRIPEQVCVSGYDNLEESRLYMPSLTSVEVSYEKLAGKAIEIIDHVCSGQEQDRVEYVKPELRFRKSCGCGEQEYREDWAFPKRKAYVQENNIKQIVFMTTDCQDAFEEEEYLRVAEKYVYNIAFDQAYLCLCDGEEQREASGFTENMILKRIFTREHQTVRADKKFSRRELLPEEILETEGPGAFLVFSIHHKHKAYGYMAFTFSEGRWPDSFAQAYLMCLANAMEDGVMHKNVTNLEEIRKIYLQDPLTEIYNRRGFEKCLRQLYERACREGSYLSIVSIDMDGLKYINDHFGHGEGDDALRRLAGVIEGLAGEDEVCARMGGDEFAMLLLSDKGERHRGFERVFLEAVKAEERRIDKPYPLHASIGICCIKEKEKLSLMECIQLADRRMYEQKKKSKMTREKLINK